MKKLFFIAILLFPVSAFCQPLPVQVNIYREKINGYEYILHIEIAIEKGWHIYALADIALGIYPTCRFNR